MKMADVTFRSRALGREIPYRVLLPDAIPPDTKLPVVYLLHGKGDTYRSWSNNSDVARFASGGLILVCVEGSDSWYINGDSGQSNYGDYLFDVVADVEQRFPARADRGGRSIVGNSMGGYGAEVFATKHPEVFGFVGTLGGAFDAPRRAFSWRRFWASLGNRRVFGPMASKTRTENDPYKLVHNANPEVLPYSYLLCGKHDPLFPVNREFDRLLTSRNVEHEFHEVRGGHNWTAWNENLDDLFRALNARTTTSPGS